VLAVSALAASGLSAARAATDDGVAVDLLDRAQEAAQSESFTGIVLVEWSDGSSSHSQEVRVSSAGGVMRFGDELMGSGALRLVHGTGGWLTLWNHDVKGLEPPPSAKYAFSVSPGPVVATRPTQVVEVRLVSGTRPQERLYVDQISGLILRRELVDAHGRPYRSVGFAAILPADPVAKASSAAPPSADQQPGPAGTVRAPYRAPRRLGAGYRLVGSYHKEGDVLHFFYSDGLHGLSVFEQRGRLTKAALPGGGREVEVSGHGVRSYAVSVGEAMVWEGEGIVYTVVSDAPWVDAAAVVKDLPHAAERPRRLRRLADVVVSVFRLR